MRNGQWLTDINLNTVFGQLPARLIEWLLGSLIVAPIAALLTGIIVFSAAQIFRKKISNYEAN